MNRILVPVDFTGCAEKAIEFAADLAKKLNAKITLFHAYDIPYSSGYTPYELYANEIAHAKKASDDNLKKISAKIKKKYGLNCKIRSGHELTIESIINAVEEEQADLVVMGTGGAVTVSKRVAGTNALAVSKQASCPVLIVPETWKLSNLKNIAIATDYQEKDIDRICAIIEMFKPMSVHFSIVHVAAKKEDTKTEMARFIEAIREKTGYSEISPVVLPNGSVQEKLEMYLQERSADLLVMAPHHHSLIEKLFGKSVSKKLITHPSTPLLTVH